MKLFILLLLASTAHAFPLFLFKDDGKLYYAKEDGGFFRYAPSKPDRTGLQKVKFSDKPGLRAEIRWIKAKLRANQEWVRFDSRKGELMFQASDPLSKDKPWLFAHDWLNQCTPGEKLKYQGLLESLNERYVPDGPQNGTKEVWQFFEGIDDPNPQTETATETASQTQTETAPQPDPPWIQVVKKEEIETEIHSDPAR